MTKIEGNAFQGCTGLTSIFVSEGNKVYDSRDNCNAIIETESNTLIKGCINTVIPDSVTEIGKYAFGHCTDLTNVVIGNSVKVIGEFAFIGCTGLKNISIPDSVISLNGFRGCTGLTSVTIPDSVTEIGEYAFSDCTGLTHMIIPESVTDIADRAFANCDNLASVVMINLQTKINDYSFPENTEIIRKEGEYKPKRRLTLKDYVPSLQFVFEEFDMDEFDGSYYTKDGILSELFDSDEMIDALGEDGVKYVDEMSKEDIHDAVANVALLLDQGSIKSLSISDGDKTIYKDSNKKPFHD